MMIVTFWKMICFENWIGTTLSRWHMLFDTQRELDTMLEMRPIPRTKEEIAKLSQAEIKHMHQFRYSYTRRRATPEELKAGVKVGIWKCRIVSKDLKVRFKRPMTETHSKVPSTSTFRLLVAATNLKDFEVWVPSPFCVRFPTSRVHPTDTNGHN